MPAGPQHDRTAAPFRLRAARPSDTARLARSVVAGFEGYRAFAPPGWTPPSLTNEIGLIGTVVGALDVWALLAEAGGELAGHTIVIPAARAYHPLDDPAVAHLRSLFVERRFWGTGVATALHGAALEAAREHGFERVRLFTPAGQARARRFYEREGWALVRGEFHDRGLALPMVEYRRPLGQGAA